MCLLRPDPFLGLAVGDISSGGCAYKRMSVDERLNVELKEQEQQ